MNQSQIKVLFPHDRVSLCHDSSMRYDMLFLQLSRIAPLQNTKQQRNSKNHVARGKTHGTGNG